MITVEHLVASNIEKTIYQICMNPKCNIVYFSDESFYEKKDLKTKVWFKETSSPVPICYCKGVTDTEIMDHILYKECCSNITDIQKHTGANTGNNCITKNPTGK